ncbi:MAG: metalloregulator ArsR/SmtB family transcription factor [Pseudomonadota bacterium]
MDDLFKALADPARRTLLDALRDKDGQTLSQLEAHLEMSRFGVMKHLGILEEAHLITTTKRGRFKHHYLNAARLQAALDHWIEPYRAKPAARALLDLKETLEGTPPMSDDIPDFVIETFIRCSHAALWDALTKADAVAHYHFVASHGAGDMTAAGDRLAFCAPDGSEIVAHTVNAIDPKSRIDVTFEPNWDEVKTHSRCVFLVEPLTDACKLRVEHYAIPAGHEGVAEGWARTLSGLKTWLETGVDARFGFEENVA